MLHERRFSIFIYARILVLFVFLVVSLLLHYKDPATADFAFSSGIIRLMAFSFVFSVFSHILLKIQRIRFFITYLQSIWDVLFVTVLLLFTDGVNSPYSFLYLLSIMNAGLLLGRREALYTASLCGILYGTLVDFHYFGLLESIGLSSLDAVKHGETQIFYTIFLNLMGYGVAAFITGYLAERARESEAALEEKNVDYAELAGLNSLIVTKLETGLMTITDDGRIRVFNPYLERLTGLSQREAYNRVLYDIFPGMNACSNHETPLTNSEIEYEDPDGRHLLIGYSVTSFGDRYGKQGGCLVTVQDMTELRRMENALAKRDRMAALGELSARMAHEIRNPLASMSGAVQMLAEHNRDEVCDERLMGIILRESERLNILITEFLLYARPSEPKKESFALKFLIDDLALQISADSRYHHHKIQNMVPSTLVFSADPAQMRQIFINLICNAADAMPDGGNIDIESRFLLTGADGFGASPILLITVRDHGSGLTPESIKHIFEPFWTTKTNGTGLGLAITYRIVESHGGTITIENHPDGGCCCTLLLPK